MNIIIIINKRKRSIIRNIRRGSSSIIISIRYFFLLESWNSNLLKETISGMSVRRVRGSFRGSSLRRYGSSESSRKPVRHHNWLYKNGEWRIAYGEFHSSLLESCNWHHMFSRDDTFPSHIPYSHSTWSNIILMITTSALFEILSTALKSSFTHVVFYSYFPLSPFIFIFERNAFLSSISCYIYFYVSLQMISDCCSQDSLRFITKLLYTFFHHFSLSQSHVVSFPEHASIPLRLYRFREWQEKEKKERMMKRRIFSKP